MVGQETILDSALDAWQVAFQKGEDRPAADFCRDHPDLLPVLEERIVSLRKMFGVLRAKPAPPPAVADDTAVRNDLTPPPQDSLGGYRLLHRLGRGGMGEVYRAEDPALGRQVAIKVMRPEHAAAPTARERFLREARAAAALHHDHIVPIFHVGEDGGVPYLVMPLLQGQSLEARRASGPLSLVEVVRIGREAALGLAAAHAKGLIHRDVKPANLWLEAPTGRVKLLDFGLVRSADGSDGLTRVGGMLGTPAYMAPEQADGSAVDGRTDLFSLGVTLHEAATGERLFARPTLTATLRAVAEYDPKPPHEVNPAVPRPLSDLILRLLAKSPDDRPPSADAVAAELEAMATQLETVTTAPTNPPRKRRFVPLLLGTIGVVLLGLVLLFLQTCQPQAPNPELPSIPAPKPTPEPPQPSPPTPAVVLPPLSVQAIEVRPHAPGDGGYTPLHLFGQEDRFSATVEDAIRVTAKLSRPAYCYLIVFQADGQDQVLYPQADTDIPEKTDRPAYPTKRRDAFYGLDEGAGLWAVAVVTSDEPLPSYKEWRQKHAGGPWKANPATPNLVLFDDGNASIETFAPGKPSTRGSRGEKTDANQTPLVGLVDWLKSQTGSPAAALAFPVTPPTKKK